MGTKVHPLRSRVENQGPVLVETAAQAWKILQQHDAPNLVVLDWILPDFDARALHSESYVYVVRSPFDAQRSADLNVALPYFRLPEPVS